LAKRIETVLPKLEHSDQTGFMKGRYIGENIRLINDVMEYTMAEKKGGILVSLDFKKAFDTLEWQFVKKILGLFNFGENVKKWVRIFYANIESTVINMVSPPTSLNQQGGSDKAVRFPRISSYLGPKYYRTDFVRQSKSKGLIYLETRLK